MGQFIISSYHTVAQPYLFSTYLFSIHAVGLISSYYTLARLSSFKHSAMWSLLSFQPTMSM